MQNLEGEGRLKSHHSREEVHLQIYNPFETDVDIIWINYSGEYVKYGRLGSQRYIQLVTYATHPWIAIDSKRKNRLLLNRKFVFVPMTWDEYWTNFRPGLPLEARVAGANIRLLVKLSVPIYSLRYRTLLEVQSYLKTEADADSLDVPKTIKDDLKLLLAERQRFPWND